jgi:hypothetical protein
MSRIGGQLEGWGGGAAAVEPGLALRASRATKMGLAALLAVLAAATLASHPFASAPGAGQARVRPQPGHTAVVMPAGLAAAASASIGASDPRFWAVRHGGSLLATGGGIDSTFTAAGADLRVARGTLAMSLSAIGHGRTLRAVSAAAPTESANRALYSHGAISEFYDNGPYGLEQGFTVSRPQDASGSLTLGLAVGGSLTPRQSGSQILFETRAGKTALSYGELRAVDAAGRQLPAHMSFGAGTVRLQIGTRGARYPLRIDPYIQQGEKFTGGEQVSEGNLASAFGYAVALSADGNTALIGGWGDHNQVGAAWVFTRSGETWTQQGPKLTGSEEVNTGSSRVLFGFSVALSGDGNTALIGGRNDNGQTGAAWVFTRSGGTWTQQGPKLTGGEEARQGEFGTSVALSSDGNTALIGGMSDGSYGTGAAWVFTRSTSTWTQQGPKLTGGGEIASEPFNGGQFGGSVALSSDGNTALIGGAGDNAWTGAAWVFTRAGETWTQQGEKLTASGESGEGELGDGLALSSDGNTALIGAPGDSGQAGAAFVFTRSGGAWTQQGEKLTDGESGEGWFGVGVALSGDGNTAIIGAPHTNSDNGTAWVFTRSGEAWIQPGEKLTGGGEASEGKFGFETAISADGSTAMIGGFRGDGTNGQVWAFEDPPGAEPPILKGISVKKGPATGGTSVTITGARFVGVTAVEFGSVEAASYEVNSPNSITAITPGAAPGKVAVTVSNADGTSATYKKAFFTFKKVRKPKG